MLNFSSVYSGKLDVREAAMNMPDMVREAETIEDSDALTEEAAENDLETVPEEAEA
jgi:type I restriction enzyme S subunit